MTAALHRLFKRLMGAGIALCLSLCLLLMSFANSAEAARSSMSGDYEKDTVAVVHNLQETIALPQETEGHAEIERETIRLITDYMSIYRNRQRVNESLSFTTMQTALNSLAGHYKNYSNRPLSQDLKDRLNKELTKAEKNVVRGN